MIYMGYIFSVAIFGVAVVIPILSVSRTPID